MKLSTRTRYGMRAVLDIALHSGGAPVRLRDIADRQGVSLSYLEHIIGPLIAGRILRSARGAGGGVSLLRKPDSILLSEIVSLLEGPLAAVDCVLHPDVCPRSGSCATRGLWTEMAEAMDSVLGSRTLVDLMTRDGEDKVGSCAPTALRPQRSPVIGAASARWNGGMERR
ncbi:MAG: RrF2 family transcriptional regulator [Chloroflexi bacterium]|nr:RrF2 family transcriptional regulator [Chloroflexota bacterium]